MQVLISFGFLVAAFVLWALFLRGRNDIWEFQRVKPNNDPVPEVVPDPDTGALTCPACGHVGYPNADGACEACGLNLGADPSEDPAS